MRGSKGFTLIELLVVISIIALLSSVVLASLNEVRAKARDTKRIAEVRQVVNALELYFNQNGYYPTQTAVTAPCNVAPYGSALNELVSSDFIPSLPVDPVGNNSTPNRLCYHYLGIGTAANYSNTSAWYCSGRTRTDYQYTFFFSTETIQTNYPLVTTSGGVPNNEFKYCVTGPLR